MKVGVIVECPLKGVDHLVYEFVIPKLHSEIKFEIVSAGKHKTEMVNGCGKVASSLLESGCHHVLIIWDLMPRFGGEACRKEDVDAILQNLEENDVDRTKVKLVCIEPELEGWLLVDGRVLTSYKEQLHHPHPVKKFKGVLLPPSSRDAKKTIANYLERKYTDYESALRIVKHIEDFEKIADEHDSFRRLKEFLESLKRM